MNIDAVRGLIAGLGCGWIGWGADTGNHFLLGAGLVLFFASYLIRGRSRASGQGT